MENIRFYKRRGRSRWLRPLLFAVFLIPIVYIPFTNYNMSMNINFKYLFLSIIFALSIIGILFFGYIFITNLPKINFTIPTENINKAQAIPSSNKIKTELNQAFAVFNKNFNSNSENINQINNMLSYGVLTSEEVATRFLDVTYSERFGIEKTTKQKLAYKLGFVNRCKDASCFSKNSIDAYDQPLMPQLKNKNYSYVKLKDGTSYAFTYIMSSCKTINGGYDNGCGYGYVDINGKKKPNILNVDIFQFRLIRNPKNGTIKMVPFYNEKTYPNTREDCYIKGKSCTNYALKGNTDYITNRRLTACQKKSKKEVWLDEEENCCISDKIKNCCEANTSFHSQGKGLFVEKGYLGADKNVCCYDKNTSDICCKALTNPDGYILNGRCISGTIKAPLEEGKFNFVLQSNSNQGSAYLITKKVSYKIFNISGKKTVNALNLNPKEDYILYSNYENYGAKLKIVRGSCKLKNFGSNYYIISNKKAGDTCIVSFGTSKNKTTINSNSQKMQECTDCSKEISKGTYLPCCK